MHPKDADGMANSVDPDQTASSEAVWSWSALFAETYLSQYIEFIRYYKFIHDLPVKGGTGNVLASYFADVGFCIWKYIRNINYLYP